MKKQFAVLFSSVLFAASLSGCGAADRPAVHVDEPTRISEAESLLPDDAGGHTADRELPEEAPATHAWEFDTPENRGMDGALLRDLHTALPDVEIYSVVTAKNGYLVDEYYRDGYDETSVFRLNSCSKSFTSALIGIAIDQGLIRDVDVPLSEYFPQVVGTDKEGITIRHLLEHTSGIEWYEWNAGSTFREWRAEDSWVDYVLEQAVVTEPGSTFNYTTGGPHLLAAILQQATGKSAYDFALEHIFEPLGMDSVEWSADPQGVTDGGNGISMTARDAAKFGQLYLNGGSWGGRPLIPEAWVEQSTQQQSSGIGSSGVYGYQWWIQTFGDPSYDTYYAMGHAGQFIFVVPELELVTVVTSSMSLGTYEPRPYFSDYILAACA